MDLIGILSHSIPKRDAMDKIPYSFKMVKMNKKFILYKENRYKSI